MEKNISLRSTIIISIIAMIAMVAMWALTSLGYMGPNPVGQPTSYGQPMVVPAGYAFSIWSVIYLTMIVFPIYHWFQKQEGHLLWKQVHFWYAINVICNGLWLICASFSWQILTVVIILFMLVTLYKINDLLIRIHKVAPQNYWLERIGFSMYMAWITLASALNISAALHYYQWRGLGISEITWSLIFIPVVVTVAILVFIKYRDRAFAGVVIWAFIALAVKQIDAQPPIGYAAVVVVALFTVLWIWMGRPIGSVVES